ncbi:tyrosine-protein kinase Lyn-like [Contarinia nasturtii]|uniref:tyrosine-protein kinase Lyn-like n=1 Tax=Contarinia nasturtii TaxID=265458 RepID=UPI0012D3DA0F|nr:tyrosine-protein kinase Lyn-like [Contarinia nasturtii]
MTYFNYCLLFSGLLVVVTGGIIQSLIEGFVEKYFNSKNYNLTGLSEHKLEFVDGAEIGRSDTSIVWLGIYNDKTDVAVKMFWNNYSIDKEMVVYAALNAVDDHEIEDHKIPRIYYHGKLNGGCYAIAMSLFDGTLFDYYNDTPNGDLLNVDILYVLMQLVKGLQYLSTKNVVHNDIKPQNLFYRGRDAFISDFNLATINGAQNKGKTLLFASANFFADKSRFAMDDLESLIYSLWYLAGVPLDPNHNHQLLFESLPEGYALFENRKKGKTYAKSKLMEKCKHFKNDHVRGVFEYICDKELLSDKTVPNYEAINHVLINAIRKMGNKEGAWFSDDIRSILLKLQNNNME